MKRSRARRYDASMEVSKGIANPKGTAVSILDEAKALVHGARQSSYGHPADNWEQTAQLWSAVLGVPVTAEQAVLCMIVTKIARECHEHKRDSLTDIAGYAEVLNMIHERREKEGPAKQEAHW